MWELRGRNINEELYTPSIGQLPPGPIHVQSTVQMLVKKSTPISKRTPASVSTISPKSCSDLDTGQDEIINEMLRKVAQTFNQTLLMAMADNPTSNLDSNSVPHDSILDRQPAPTINTNDIQRQTIPPQKNSYQLDSTDHIRTDPIRNFKRTNIMDINALSYSPKLHNKILQGLNLHGLCQYSKSHKAYIFEKSNRVVNFSYVLIFLRQSMCYVITSHTHHDTKLMCMKYLSHKLLLCDDQSAHMPPLPPPELPEINAFTTITRLTLL